MGNTLQNSSTLLLIAAFMVGGGIIFPFNQWGHTSVSHTLRIKTFCLPVAQKTVELLEPSACLSSLLSLSTSPFLFFPPLCYFPSAAVFENLLDRMSHFTDML